MKDTTKFVGLDVSKDNIAVAVADAGREAPRFWGKINHTFEAVKKLMERLGEPGSLEVCYEAGPTGYELYRWLIAIGISCPIIAPSLTPKRPGDHVKTDRRDAVRLAQLFRAGELMPIYVPDSETESLRDLVRAREDAKEDVHRSKQRILKFFLRRQIHAPSGMKNWSQKYWSWLEAISFSQASDRIVLQEYLQAIREDEQRLKRLEKEIEQQAIISPKAPLINALQALRGIKVLTATTLVAEIGSFTRFPSAQQFMSYIGVVPREYSSGSSQWRGKIIKAGNAHLRRVIVESSWSYRYKPGIKQHMRKRLMNQTPMIQHISWKAQTRLHDKYIRMLFRGKAKGQTVTAIARELAGFIWAVGRETELGLSRLDMEPLRALGIGEAGKEASHGKLAYHARHSM